MLAASFFLGLAAFSFAHANLLQDGGFEAGSWGKWKLQGGSRGAIGVTSPGYTGKYAGTQMIHGKDGEILVYYPTLNVTAGKQYIWSVDFKLNNPNCSTVFQNYEGILIALGDGLNKVPIGKWASYNATWVPARDKEGVNIGTYCVGDDAPRNSIVAEFDNMVIEPVSNKVYNASSPPTGPNMVTQPNFESGTLKAYHVINTVNDTTKIVSPGYKGAKYAASVTTHGVFANPGASEIIQTIHGTQEGKVYLLSFAAKITKKLGFTCSVFSFIQQGGFPAGTEFIPYQSLSNIPPNKKPVPVGKWQVHSAVLSGLSDNFQIGLDAECLFGRQEFLFDDIKLLPLD